MKTSLKTLLAAIALLSVAAMTANAQTYKPDWVTKMVLAKSGNDPSNTVTLLAGANTSNLTLTLPAAAPGGNGYVLTATTGGVMSWTNPASAVTLAGDVTGNAGSNTVAKINGVTLGTGTASPSDGFMLLYNAGNSAWEGHAMSGDVTISNTGATAIGTGKVTSAMILDGTIANADVAANAAIAYSKLNLTGSIVNADIASGAAIAYNKLNLTGSIVNADITDATITGAKLVDGTVTNGKLANSSLTVTAGAGLSGGGSVALGGSTTISANIAHDGTLTGNGGSSNLGLDLTSANTWSGTQTLGGVALTKASVSTANATENDYALSSSNAYFYLTSTATSGTVISSISGGTDGRLIVLVNAGAKNITLLNDDGSTGTAANRFHFAGGVGADLILAPDGIVTLVYDGTSTNHRWRLVSAQ